ncbi:endonuclease/exonuclease/phosphatase family protein [Parasphingopyxis lamellibrachiae]|uniref:Endonuclease/exonuclease/phosphatase family metal-dependent hydrolase n=1 Tax=Parasphingopyxis lamellibrachiae TaxID=680125 RepID=A0A3D9FIL9_9SPHN|nr:endonuclease/exonuclease/phosphatase family protein [Parasphingopyxis lamellibrachiae]RED17488.1 endonuclease/exonuclease/phosphatase family metal-dependent hydrolase [Parasphingopyxis lamellibrachiae]
MNLKTVKVASYNMHKGVGADRRRNPERIVKVLNGLDADIVALQEADRRFGRRSAAIPPLLLEQNSDYQPIPLDVQIDSMGWHGNAILARKSATIHMHDVVHIPCLEPRGAVMAQIEVNGIALCVFGMHLDLSGLWRRKQAQAVVKLAEEYGADMPTVLMGDLNEWSAASGCLRDFSRAYAFADCGRSFHARRPTARLDRIMHCSRLQVIESGVDRSAIARKASDHLPVWARITPA